MIKFLRKKYIGFLKIFDREFVARALNIHHPSEEYAWNAYYNRMRKDYEEFEKIRMELFRWHWLMRKFGCQTIQEFEQVINDLCKNRSPADPQYVDEWFRFKKMF